MNGRLALKRQIARIAKIKTKRIRQVDAQNSERSVHLTISAAAEDARQIEHQISKILEMLLGPARFTRLRVWGSASFSKLERHVVFNHQPTFPLFTAWVQSVDQSAVASCCRPLQVCDALYDECCPYQRRHFPSSALASRPAAPPCPNMLLLQAKGCRARIRPVKIRSCLDVGSASALDRGHLSASKTRFGEAKIRALKRFA
ncbi:hypothetical protein IWX47DRAFT_57062 [Phyllosticta citricarpa]